MLFVLTLLVLFLLGAFLGRTGRPPGARARAWVPPLTAGVALTVLVCLAASLSRSLWIDEFGTLWAIEDSVAEAWSRALSFHGQSPLYYVLLWPVVHVIGESEVVLRVPSLVCGAATTWLIYRTTVALGSREAALFAASLIWVTPTVMEGSVSARAYALALMFAALAVHGFTLRVLGGGWRYRALFVIGGAGLFLTQYVSSLVMLGLGAGYLWHADVRVRYPWRDFLVDVAIQLAVVVVALPQVMSLWGRRENLDWIGTPNYVLAVGVLGPFLLPILIASVHRLTAPDRARQAVEQTLVLAVAAQVVLLTMLAAVGPNLLAPRYLVVGAVPAAILGGLALSRLRTPAASLCVAFAILLTTGLSLVSWRVTRVPVLVPNQDWRSAVWALDSEIRRAPNAPVLYRPGFVEQDPTMVQSSALLAPLRSPGAEAPRWNVIHLTFSWWSPSREPYFEQVLVPALETADVLFVLASGPSPVKGDYVPLLIDWIERRFPGQFDCHRLGPFTEVDLLRFDRRAAGSFR